MVSSLGMVEAQALARSLLRNAGTSSKVGPSRSERKLQATASGMSLEKEVSPSAFFKFLFHQRPAWPRRQLSRCRIAVEDHPIRLMVETCSAGPDVHRDAAGFTSAKLCLLRAADDIFDNRGSECGCAASACLWHSLGKPPLFDRNNRRAFPRGKIARARASDRQRRAKLGKIAS